MKLVTRGTNQRFVLLIIIEMFAFKKKQRPRNVKHAFTNEIEL